MGKKRKEKKRKKGKKGFTFKTIERKKVFGN
jgi:hypothetical protein